MAAADALRLSPLLHRLPTPDLESRSRYRTAFVPAGGFVIVVDDEQIVVAHAFDLRTLERRDDDLSTRQTRWRLRYEVDRPGEPQQRFDRKHPAASSPDGGVARPARAGPASPLWPCAVDILSRPWPIPPPSAS